MIVFPITDKSINSEVSTVNLFFVSLAIESVSWYQAAQAIFSQRNSEMSISRGQLDLHGLHVAEATACLHELLPVLALSPVAKAPITIVTGSGHHSVGGQKGKPRLLPAVQGVLDELGYEYQLVKDVNGFVSGVNVRLR